VQGMGFPTIPMASGVLEMVLRVGAISLLIGSLGFRATAFAEVFAWCGALLMNAVAFYVIFTRESKKYAPNQNVAGCLTMSAATHA